MRIPGEMKAEAERLAIQLAAQPAADVVGACREFIRDYGTLPKPLGDLYRKALRALRSEAAERGTPMSWLARRLGITPDRMSKLTSPEAVTS